MPLNPSLKASNFSKAMQCSSRNDTKTHCFLSPHADDIAFSAMGSLLCLPQSTRKLLVTIFSTSCWTFERTPTCDQWQEVTAKRLDEDRHFAAVFGCEYRHFSLADSSLRDYNNGREYATSPEQDPIFPDVTAQLSQLVAEIPDGTVLYVPLGVGQHIDHLIVRAALSAVCGKGHHIIFYEDLPYAEQYSETQIEALAKSIDSRLQSRLLNLQEHWAKKIQGIQIYSSQLEAHTYSRIEKYADRIGGSGLSKAERIWTTYF